MARRPFSKPTRAKEERNGPPSADQGFLQLSPEAATLPGPRVEARPPPPVPAISQAESCMTFYRV